MIQGPLDEFRIEKATNQIDRGLKLIRHLLDTIFGQISFCHPSKNHKQGRYILYHLYLRRFMLHYSALCYTVLCYTILCYTVRCTLLLPCLALSYSVFCCPTPQCTVQSTSIHCPTLSRVVLHSPTPYFTTLHCPTALHCPMPPVTLSAALHPVPSRAPTLRWVCVGRRAADSVGSLWPRAPAAAGSVSDRLRPCGRPLTHRLNRGCDPGYISRKFGKFRTDKLFTRNKRKF